MAAQSNAALQPVEPRPAKVKLAAGASGDSALPGSLQSAASADHSRRFQSSASTRALWSEASGRAASISARVT